MEQITDKLAAIRGCAKRLRLSCLTSDASEVLLTAQKESPSYDDFLLSVLSRRSEAGTKSSFYFGTRLQNFP